MTRFITSPFAFGLLSFILLTSCAKDDSSDENDLSKKLVVEAYVYAGLPIDHVKISKIHEDGNSTPLPVSAAQVKIYQDNQEFVLTSHPEIAGRYVQSDTSFMPVDYGESKLQIIYQGRTYKAYSEMPESISNLEVSAEYVSIIPGDDETTLATISWNPVENVQGYCIFVKNLDQNPVPINNANNAEASQNPFRIIHQNHTVELKSSHFSHYGEYEIYVTAVNEEYARIYETNSPGTFSAAPSNIQNGLGVFTNFNGKSETIVVQ